MKNTKKFSFVIINILSFIIGILMFLVAFPLVNKTVNYSDNSAIASLLCFAYVFISFLVSQFLSVIIHEGGHFIFGKASGYKFSSFRIGSICFVKSENKIKIKFFRVPGTLGQCLMLPPEEDENGEIPYKLYNAGGCIFNGIFFLLFALFAIIFFNVDLILYVAGSFALVNFLFLINNGIPMRTQFVQNDGQNVKDIAKNKQAMRSFAVQLLVAEAQARGVSVCDMPNEWFEKPNEAQFDNPLISTHAYFIFVRLLTQGDFYNAHIYAQKILKNGGDNILGIHKLLLELELIYLDTVNNWQDPQSIAKRLNDLKKTLKPFNKNLTVQRVLYTVELLVFNNREQANKHLELFNKLAKKHPYKQEALDEINLINLAKEKYGSF